MSSSSIYPSALETAIFYGFNIKTQDFCTTPLFDGPDSDDLTSITWAPSGIKCDDVIYPDKMVTVSTSSALAKSSESVYLQNKSDYNEQFSASLKLSGSYMGYSGSSSTHYFYHENIFTETTKSFFLNFAYNKVLSFNRITNNSEQTTNTPSSTFNKDLLALPQDFLKGSSAIQQYFDFLDTYGTHYVESGVIGGYATLLATTDDNAFSKESATDVSEKINAGFNDCISSGSLDASVASDKAKLDSSVSEKTSMTFNIDGGETGATNTKDWEDSLYGNNGKVIMPQPGISSGAGSTLKTISELISFLATPANENQGQYQSVAQNIELIMQAYMINETFIPVFNPPFSNKVDVQYSDNNNAQLFMAPLTQAGNGEQAHLDSYIEEKFVAGTSIHYDEHTHIYEKYGSITLPIPNNCTASVNTHIEAGKPSATVWQWLMTSNYQYLDGDDGTDNVYDMSKWQIDISDSKPEVDLSGFENGFLIAGIGNGSGTHVTSHMYVENAQGNEVVGTSQYYYPDKNTYVPKNSFCLPLQNTDNLKLKLITGYGKPTSFAYFIPTPGNVSFGAPTALNNTSETRTADTDGFLVVFLHANEDDTHGYAHLYSCPPGTDLNNVPPMTNVSVQYNKGSYAVLGHGTATLPICRGHQYKVDVVYGTSKKMAVSAFFVPTTYQNQ